MRSVIVMSTLSASSLVSVSDEPTMIHSVEGGRPDWGFQLGSM